MNDAPSPDGPLHATGDQDGPKSESTPTTEEDTLLVDAGGKTHSVSRAKLLKQQRISHLCDLAQDPGVHHTALEGVSPECADAFMTYLQTGAVTPENTALPPLGQAGQTHQLLALAQECHHLERRARASSSVQSSLSRAFEFVSRCVVRWVVDVGRFLLRKVLRLLGFKSQWHTTSIGRLHLLNAKGRGTLPTVVVLHGVTSCSTDYSPLLVRLQRKCQRVLALDLPAHGLSTFPPEKMHRESMLAGFQECLAAALNGIEGPVVLYGNSMGAIAATHFATNHPEKVQGLFFSSPGGAPVTHDDIESFMSTFKVTSAAEGRLFFERLFAKKPPFKPLIAMGIQGYLARKDVRLLINQATPEDFLTEEMVSSLPQRHIVFSWGKQDQVLRNQDREWWRRVLPAHAVVQEPEDFGHIPFWDNPTLLTRQICDLAREVQNDQGLPGG